MPYQIEFEPVGRRGQCPEEQSLLDCARQLGVGLVSICGGQGKCYACKVQILRGLVSEVTSTERKVFPAQEIKSGWRLACLTYPRSDCALHLPPESMTTLQRMQTEGRGVSVTLEPAVNTCTVKLEIPTLHDLRSDTTRIFQALLRQNVECDRIDIDVLRRIPLQLRDWNWEARVSVREREIVALSPLSTRPLGLAVDQGTTKIAGYLIDLTTGQTLAARGIMNPQISYGEDITSRIRHVIKSSQDAARLQDLAMSSIDQLAGELCEEVKAGKEEILDAVIVGNAAIHHLMLGIAARGLAYSPFVAAVQEALDIKARDIGLHLAPGAYVHVLPNIAGFVGADHVSMLLAIDAGKIKETTVAIDIGTNSEVSLITDGIILSASCASGPAFEGGHITHGMRASSGAIEWLKVVNGEIDYQTVDNAPPIGICGSGVIDSLAQFYTAGMLGENGRIGKDSPHSRDNGDQREFVLARKENGYSDITFTQHDIRELQLAKAAIRSGIQILLESAGRTEEDIKRVIIAGAFGAYIDITSAIDIGMLPAVPLKRFRQVGNAAGMGAGMALISRSKRLEAQKLASRARYIELATAPNFMKTFSQATYLGKYRLQNGQREPLKK